MKLYTRVGKIPKYGVRQLGGGLKTPLRAGFQPFLFVAILFLGRCPRLV
jgi:hypothetical protein